MSKFKKLAVCGLAGVMALGVGASLTACGGKEASKATVDQLYNEFVAGLAASKDSVATEYVPTITTANVEAATMANIKIATQFTGKDAHKPILDAQKTAFLAANSLAATAINDQSFSMEEQTSLDKFTLSMTTEADMPDVIFFTSGAAVDKWRGSLVSRAELVKIDAAIAGDITSAFLGSTSDKAVFPMKSGAEMIMYNSDKLNANVFSGTVDKMTRELSKVAGTANGVTARGDLPHYWLNHYICSYLGAAEFNAFDGTQAYLKKTGKEKMWKEALTYAVDSLKAIGFNGSKAVANETSFYAGNTGALLDGQWAASNLDDTDTTPAAVAAKIQIAAFPAGGYDNEQFCIGGITNGWYITKHAATNAGRLKTALAFVKQMNTADAMQKFCAAGGGVPANGVPSETLTEGVKKFMSEAGKYPAYVAIDDRVSAAAKTALMGDWTEGSTMFKLLNNL